jgi:hypothetical protein
MKIVSRKHNVRHKHKLKLGNQSFERVEHFKYLGTTLINHSSFQEEIKSRQRAGHACCHPLQSLLSSSLPSNDMNIYRTVILPVVLSGCETRSLTPREERRLRVSRLGC